MILWLVGCTISNIDLNYLYNVQHGVDVDSIMICGVNVSLSPTDHYEIPALMDVVLNNIPVEKPDMISADTIYRTIINLTYLKEKGITPPDSY